MHETSALYKSILADERHRKEVKIIIAGVEYTEANITACSITGGIFSAPKIGGCASRQLSMKIIPEGTIPRQAKAEVFIRLVSGDRASEWIPKGTFFFATRQEDKLTGVVTVKAFDAMLKANAQWLGERHKETDFPMSQVAAVADIAAQIGVEIDPRTELSEQFPVYYPVAENGDLTMWEVLGYIAASNAGNWVISDEGKLRLLRYGDIPTETFYLVTEGGDAITIGGVRIVAR